MGFGHRVYKSYDPRAKVIKRIADLVFTVTGKNPLLEIALELERIALEDDYFVSRKLYPNVDFYSGPHLPGDGFSGRNVPGPLRHPAHGRLDRAVGRDAARPRTENRAAAADLHRFAAARLRAAGSAQMTVALAARGVCLAQAAAAHDVRLEPRLGPPSPARHHRAAAVGVRGHRADAHVHQGSADRRRRALHGAELGAADAARQRAHGQPRGHPARRAQGTHHRHGPLRHEAVSRVPIRRRERRRVERRVPHRARAGPEGAEECADDRAAVSRRRGSAASRLAGHRQHLRQPALRRDGAQGRHARGS